MLEGDRMENGQGSLLLEIDMADLDMVVVVIH